jgi:uncharacterized membrane protein YesL
MSWITQYLTREGPGVPRHAAPKEGLALLGAVVVREWWTLIELNLLYVLFCLPLVTIPAAQVAATRVVALMLADRNVYLLRDFWETFRARFRRATAFGLLAFAVLGIAVYAAVVFLQAARTELLFALPLAVSGATAVFVAIAAAYGFALLAMGELPLGAVIRLSLLGALARPLPPLAAFGVVALLWLLHVAFYPASIFMPAVVNFSFGTLAVTFGVHKAAARLLASHPVRASAAPVEEQACSRTRNKGRKLS